MSLISWIVIVVGYSAEVLFPMYTVLSNHLDMLMI